MELFGYAGALIALVEQPQKVELMLESLTAGTAELALLQAECGADALLVSSAFAGAGFISREHYRRFVLPYEHLVVERVRREARVPIYVHTCGAIGDRIDLMVEASYDGIDPVNVVLKGTPEQVYVGASRLIEKAGRGGGYILSTACPVAPQAPAQNIAMLNQASVDHPI